jgi:ketosteroid isomerase-like protein
MDICAWGKCVRGWVLPIVPPLQALLSLLRLIHSRWRQFSTSKQAIKDMKPFAFLFGVVTILSLTSCDQSDNSQNENTGQNLTMDSTTIKDLIKKYTESINAADTVLGSALFSHTKEVTFIHPLGHARGWDEINKTIYTFFRETFSTRELKASNEHVSIYENTAWVEFYWTFDAKFKQDDAPFQSKGRETQIWQKTNEKWNLVHVHYSGMPVTNLIDGL